MEENNVQVEEAKQPETETAEPNPEAEVAVQEEEAKEEESTEEAPKAKVYTEKEVEAMMRKKQSDVDKGVQKLIAEAKFKDAVIDAVKQVSADNKALVEIYEKNPRVAKEILEKYYDGQSIEDYKAGIGYKEDLTDPAVYKRKVERETEKRLEAMRIEQAKEAFIEKLKITDEDERAEFEKEFDARKDLKTFKAEDVETHLEKAYRAIDKTDKKALRKQEVVAKSQATGVGKSSGGEKAAPVNEYRAFLDKFMPR